MAISAPIPPATRAAATWARAGKPGAALLLDDGLTVVVGSAVLGVPVEVVLVSVVVGLVVGVVGVVGVVKVVAGVITAGVVGVVKIVGVVKVVVGLKESTKGELEGRVRMLDVPPRSVGEDNTVSVASPYG